MFKFKIALLFLSLHLTLISGVLASTIMSSDPIEQDISEDFSLGPDFQIKNENKSLRLGYFSGEKWAGITLANHSAQTIEKFLYFDTLTGKLDLFEQNNLQQQKVLVSSSGSSFPFLKREIPSLFSAFKVSVPPMSEKVFSFKIITRHNFNSKVYLGTLDTLNVRKFNKISFLDFYIGGIVCLILYNFFIFIFLKDINYLYYCLFSLSFMLTILNIHGMLDQFFLTTTFSFSHYLICFSSMTLLFATLFTKKFIEVPTYFQKSLRYFQVVQLLCGFIFFTGITPLDDLYPEFFGTLIDILLITTNISFITIAFLLRKKSSTSRYYLFSWVIVGISLLAWFGMTFGLFPNNFFTEHALLYANLGQMITLSLALAFRINNAIKEKLIAEEKALQKERYQRLVKVLSHDISNSLTIINSYSKILVRSNEADPEHQRLFEKIYIAGENIKNILTNVREEALLTERKKSIELHPTNVYEAIRDSALLFEDQLKIKNIELKINIPKDLEINANRTCFLNNIVNNILSNAIKFSYSNSQIEIYSEDFQNFQTIYFRDYGEGINPLLIKDIYFSDKLISSSGTNHEVGNGFGTTLMREYVEMFAGKLKVESSLQDENDLNRGTTIILKFPSITRP
jgi:adenylate cyclase